jgi:excisionase family DNA binding protein
MMSTAMAGEPPHRGQLHSWKEIAQYLGVTERTAQKWERERGLPVHRMPGEKGRVVAWLDELDRWRSSGLDKPAWWVSVGFWRVFALTSAAVLLAVTLGVALDFLLRTRAGPPVRFVLEGRSLRALDANGREAWRTLLEQPAAEGVSPAYWLSRRLAWFGDLNADGRTEFLYAHHPDSYSTAGDTLICYSHTGRVLWRYRNTRTVASRSERFAPPWLVAFVMPLPPSPGGARRVLVVTHHLSWYPAQVAVLSSEGRLLGEYWHSGHILFGETAETRRRPRSGSPAGRHQQFLQDVHPDRARPREPPRRLPGGGTSRLSVARAGRLLRKGPPAVPAHLHQPPAGSLQQAFRPVRPRRPHPFRNQRAQGRAGTARRFTSST